MIRALESLSLSTQALVNNTSIVYRLVDRLSTTIVNISSTI